MRYLITPLIFLAVSSTSTFAAVQPTSGMKNWHLCYDGEQRMNSLGQPIEWQLAMVAPGVYRWHATDWRVGQVNTVVGIQCNEG